MIFLPHIILLLHWAGAVLSPLAKISVSLSLILIYLLNLSLLHVMPYRDKANRCQASPDILVSNKAAARLKIMNGGRRIFRLCFWGVLIQFLFYIFKLYSYPLSDLSGNGIFYILSDGILTFLFFYGLILNGCIRILLTCRSLGVWKRILILFFLWMPVVHLFCAKYLSKRAAIEYSAEVCRFENRIARDGSMLCATRYPIVMLHGIGFRDLCYFNYWGRIPKELVHNGAIVYYGHQQAWGTIEDNADIICQNIRKILKENHCEKVNIIAHSKGGLDARYLISGLHMEDCVASLTTISTPHRGSELLNILNKLPDGIYRLIASGFDRTFKRLGDPCPDCYHASKQLSSGFCQEFNEKYPDSPKVYYQSYASYVKHTFGDNLLSIPNLLMFFTGAPKNDGLVTVDSAKWGHVKKTFASSGRRGISHGDMIDLKREDYKGFDVIEAYVQIVAELKEMGF